MYINEFGVRGSQEDPEHHPHGDAAVQARPVVSLNTYRFSQKPTCHENTSIKFPTSCGLSSKPAIKGRAGHNDERPRLVQDQAHDGFKVRVTHDLQVESAPAK